MYWWLWRCKKLVLMLHAVWFLYEESLLRSFQSSLWASSYIGPINSKIKPTWQMSMLLFIQISIRDTEFSLGGETYKHMNGLDMISHFGFTLSSLWNKHIKINLHSILFGRSWVQISTRRPDILIKVFCGFHQALQANSETVLCIRPRLLKFTSFSIHHSPVIFSFDAVNSELLIKRR